ncbi:uncharacterized protein VTP21DRAFT_6800 [Calcarisporiella thermophila]|uniref:uncharacterized protein n=1 Tax=Calcarisporiella thermophila TaxID=911321 RepID=UPI003742DC1A
MLEKIPVTTLVGHKSSITCLEYLEHPVFGSVLLSGSDDKTCRIWDLNTGKCIKGIFGNGRVNSAKLSPKNPMELYVACGKKIHLYDLRNIECVSSEPMKTFEFSTDEINQIAINEKGKYLGSVDDNGEVKIVDLETRKIYKQFRKKHENISFCISFRPRRTWEVLTGGFDCCLIQWDFSRGSPTNIFNMNEDTPSSPQVINPPFIYDLAVSNDGRRVALALGSGSISLLTQEGKAWSEKKLASETRFGPISGVDFVDENTIVNTTQSGLVQVWGLTNEALKEEWGVGWKLNCIASSANSGSVYVGGVSEKICEYKI